MENNTKPDNNKNKENRLEIQIVKHKHAATIVWAIICLIVTVPLVIFGIWLFIAVSGSCIPIFIITFILSVIAAILCAKILSWQLNGIETLFVSPTKIICRRELYGSTQEFICKTKMIQSISVMPTEHKLGFSWWFLAPATISNFNIGRIEFICNNQTNRFGTGMTTEEAEVIVEKVLSFLDSN
ncbi:MAG: hypothetical protein MUO76_03055 [Anaerolineaceae bacterium]|nr:hypothetical protein [Anaerolineaceae bacterium]